MPTDVLAVAWGLGGWNVRVQVNGVSLAVEGAGRGVPLVLLHGFPLSSQMWGGVLPALAEVARVVAVDLRGFGNSDAPAAGYSMDALAGDILGLAEVLGLARFALAGHSMGGYVAFRVAARAPERLAALIILDSRAEADDETGRRRREEAIGRILSGGRREFLEGFLPNLISAETRQRTPRPLEELRAMAQGVPDHVLVGCLAGMRERPDSLPLLPRITMPVLAMVGQEDEITPLACARTLAEATQRGSLAIIPGAGHTPPVERPVATAEAMVAFLHAAVPAAGG